MTYTPGMDDDIGDWIIVRNMESMDRLSVAIETNCTLRQALESQNYPYIIPIAAGRAGKGGYALFPVQKESWGWADDEPLKTISVETRRF